MKKSIIVEAFRFVNGIKMNVVYDKETRAAIISNHLKMYKVVEQHEDEVKKLYEKLFDGKFEEVQSLHALRGEYNSNVSQERRGEIVEDISRNYSEIIKLENEFNEAFNGMMEEDIDICIIKMNKESFINACADSGIEFSMTEMMKIAEIFTDEDM